MKQGFEVNHKNKYQKSDAKIMVDSAGGTHMKKVLFVSRIVFTICFIFLFTGPASNSYGDSIVEQPTKVEILFDDNNFADNFYSNDVPTDPFTGPYDLVSTAPKNRSFGNSRMC